jgi:hypothetical protein
MTSHFKWTKKWGGQATRSPKRRISRHAVNKLLDKIKAPTEIKGKPIREFLNDCITKRNKLAHSCSDDTSGEIALLIGAS